MSKITFRADDDLVDQLEALDVSKSEAMREALREYLEGGHGESASERDGETAIDDLVRARVDERLDIRLRELGLEAAGSRVSDEPRDVTISISLTGARDGAIDDVRLENERPREPVTDGPDHGQLEPREETNTACSQCGEALEGDHVYCPNCGEKSTRRLFCDCGDEVRSDWSFCPGCGRRTPAADVLEADTRQR
ncbi:CopG family transcriptional regulator [Natrinema saccharevitans]|uniref:CopG family transcriptional regulator n=1 Tax=Natrinema saccharevitans TaxID=301967 RepID=A0A1S8ATG3_9EURY|nr:zinc ribbon domain-containing protein [Natrinema saccharevitans]OLZ40005.1 CopG family transcriptional regulator [Natrinema saccharevitans]